MLLRLRFTTTGFSKTAVISPSFPSATLASIFLKSKELILMPCERAEPRILKNSKAVSTFFFGPSIFIQPSRDTI